MLFKESPHSQHQEILRLQSVKQEVDREHIPTPIAPYPMVPCGLDHSLFIRDNRTLHRVAVRHMLHLEADGNYVELVLSDRRFVLRNSVAEVLKSMPEGLFTMVNRRQAVNVLLVESVSSDEVTIGRNSYTLSPRYRDHLLESLHVISGR
jgi:DNA-binding LytR/AlgR family response regulator